MYKIPVLKLNFKLIQVTFCYAQDAVKREVLEEAGLVMEPTTLIMVESAAGLWFRFVLTGTVVG